MTRLRKAGIRVEPLATGKRFSFPMAREVGMARITTMVFLCCTVVLALLFLADVPRFFAWLFGAFDLLMLFWVLDIWLYASSIEVRHGELSFAGGLMGRGSRKRWPASEVAAIRPKPGMRSGNRLFYQLEVVNRRARGYVVAKPLPDLETAELVAREIEGLLRA